MVEHSGANPLGLPNPDSFRRRAEWLEKEAHNQSRHPTRARLLMAASELRAMLGEKRRARRLAHQSMALRPGSPLVERQVRGLAQLPQEADAHLKSLKREADATGQSQALRSHALYVAGELTASCQSAPEEASKLYSLAESTDPASIRLKLPRLLDSRTFPLACSGSQGDNSNPELETALEQLRAVHQPSPPADKVGSSLALVLQSLARCLQRGDTKDCLRLASKLGTAPPLQSLSSWLLVLVHDAQSDAPEAKLQALRSLSEQPGELASHTLAIEALEMEDRATLEQAVASASIPADDAQAVRMLASKGDWKKKPEAFSAPSSTERELLTVLHRTGAPQAQPPAQSTDEQLYECGRSIVQPSALPLQLPNLTSLPPEDQAALRAEAARLNGDAPLLADALPRVFPLPDANSSRALISGTHVAEAHFAAALVLDASQQTPAALPFYRLALNSALTSETALWLLAQHDGQADIRAMLSTLCQQTRDAGHRAILLTEALFRLDRHSPDLEGMAIEATEQDPRLPLAARFAEHAARDRGDSVRAAYWMAVQRDNTASSRQEDLSRVREALLAVGANPQVAVDHLASLGANSDLATQEWREQLDPTARLEAAPVRLAAARRSDAHSQQLLIVEAACWYECAGDLVAAAQLLQSSRDALGIELWETFAERAAPDEVRTRWQEQLKSQAEPIRQRPWLLKLAQFEARKLNSDASQHWYTALRQTGDTSPATLRAIERANLSHGQEGQLLASAVALGQELPLADRLVYAYLVARLQTDSGQWQANKHLVDWLPIDENLPLWAVRTLLAHCPADDKSKRIVLLKRLLSQANNSLDKAALCLEIAELSWQQKDAQTALLFANRSIEQVPENLVALQLRVTLLRTLSMHSELAEALSVLADTVFDPLLKADSHYEASNTWLDTLGNEDRGMLALRAATLAAPSLDAPRLRIADHYLERKRPRDLCDLALRQLKGKLSAKSTLDWTILAVQALIRLGEFDDALQRLSKVLQTSPNNAEALNLNAAICHAKGEADMAVQLWRTCLATHPSEPQRLEALRGLVAPGIPIEGSEKQQRYQEILQLAPEDQVTRRQLIRQLLENDETKSAIEHQTLHLQYSSGDSERLESLLRLVELHEQTSQGREQCATLFAQAHRTWPNNSAVLTAEVQHYRKTQHRDTAQVVLERSLATTRSIIAAGRFEPDLFRTLEIACRLNGDGLGEQLARATLSTLRGKSVKVNGLDAACGNRRFDVVTVPASLPALLRQLWWEAGDAVEQAFASPAVNATPIGPEQLRQVQAIATGFGLDDLQVLVSDSLGCVCIPLRTSRRTLVFGSSLLRHSNIRVRDFLLLRALKLMAVNGCALNAMSPENSWVAVAGLFACFTDAWNANGGDAQRLISARNAIRPYIRQGLSSELQAQLSGLSRDLLPVAHCVGVAMQQWACRTALLGVGEISPALMSLWLMTQTNYPMPNTLNTRAQWIAGNAQASDLVAFSVSDAFAATLRR